MSKLSPGLRVAIAVLTMMSCGAVLAQSPQSTDLTGQDVTVDKLVGALQIPTRGIEAKCSPYQQQMAQKTRGIGVAANAVASADKVAALEPVKTASVSTIFELNSAELTPETKKMLSTVADALNSDALATQCFQLAGHTCDLGDENYNLVLSQKRAESVKAYLVTEGVSPDRLVTTGYGEISPLVPNTNEQAREKNRRVDLGALAPPALEYQ
ncbi:MAG TPA: OmpA family protein [Woeseiaceae bacterium]|nr:OmpA family protein [Woeseiaceae bacterium]